MKLVFLHGRDQQGKDPVALKQLWIDALIQGLKKNGLVLPDNLEIIFPFYGDILDEMVRQHGLPQSIEGVIARGGASSDQLRFYEQMLVELTRNAAIPPEAIDQFYDTPYKEKGPLNWEWVHALLRALDSYTFFQNQSLKKFTFDVFLYLTIPGIRRKIDEFVISEVGTDYFVLVGHSLGSVVGYNILQNLTTRMAKKFITIGSPLGLSAIKSKLQAPLSMPGCLINGWYNAYDERDVVSLNPLDSSFFNIIPSIENESGVENWTENRHGIQGYLDDPRISQAILHALT